MTAYGYSRVSESKSCFFSDCKEEFSFAHAKAFVEPKLFYFAKNFLISKKIILKKYELRQLFKIESRICGKTKGEIPCACSTVATTAPAKTPVNNYTDSPCIIYIILALSLSITLNALARTYFGNDAIIIAIILACVISLFPSVLLFALGDIVKY